MNNILTISFDGTTIEMDIDHGDTYGQYVAIESGLTTEQIVSDPCSCYIGGTPEEVVWEILSGFGVVPVDPIDSEFIQRHAKREVTI